MFQFQRVLTTEYHTCDYGTETVHRMEADQYRNAAFTTNTRHPIIPSGYISYKNVTDTFKQSQDIIHLFS
jgi:hypothetical protein